ncbi:MAG: hypothetical protein HKP61_23460 [Dactylosporangium sp.]|nr:hypothetical protein [Dactylosporangium sp.]
MPEACPCGTGRPYSACCGPLHQGQGTAASPEALMRSRFSAFAIADAGYLLRTWHPTTRPVRLQLDPHQRWTRLDVVAVGGGGPFETTGTVEFRAHYRHRGVAGLLHEHSRFVRDGGHWCYLGAVPLVE